MGSDFPPSTGPTPAKSGIPLNKACVKNNIIDNDYHCYLDFYF
ncbi:hypothetical protein CSC12_1344 [Klebsiella michiganensis]|nr:hypothetical protein CSC12_1344 [Klebsiella michiganensis]